MSGLLKHSPAKIIRQLLIDRNFAVEPSDDGEWPAFSFNEPDTPDRCITIYAPLGVKDSRTMDGEVQEHYSIQVRVRATTPDPSYEKIAAIANELDQNLLRASVTIDTSTYCIHSASRTSPIIDLNKEVPTSKRSVHVVNYLVDLRQLS